jgi:hypothetical protein
LYGAIGARDFSIIQNNRTGKFLELPLHVGVVQVANREAHARVGWVYYQSSNSYPG